MIIVIIVVVVIVIMRKRDVTLCENKISVIKTIANEFYLQS